MGDSCRKTKNPDPVHTESGLLFMTSEVEENPIICYT